MIWMITTTCEYIRKLSYETGRASALTDIHDLLCHMRARGDMSDTAYDGLNDCVLKMMKVQLNKIDNIMKKGSA